MRKYYCTMCSIEYCFQGLVLYNSLGRHDKDFILFIVCLDTRALEFLNSLHYCNLVTIDVRDIEKTYKELQEVRKQRKKHEYAWTLKPSIALYIFENFVYADHILWLDSDMRFFCSPKPLYEEWGGSSILLSEQYYTNTYEYLVNDYGKYQAGFIGFKKDKNGMECLRWWQERCIEWCFDKADNGKWADQKYLDEFPHRFKGVGVVNNLGINVTPFIIFRINNEQEKVVMEKPDGLYIDGIKIILYHYYGLRFFEHNNYDLSCYWMMFDEETINLLYLPYIKECKEVIRKVQAFGTLNFKLKSTGKNHVENYFNLDRAVGSHEYDICLITGRSDLIKCMALQYSIVQNSRSVHTWICCIDDFSFFVLTNTELENTTIINSRSFETLELQERKKRCDEKEYSRLIKAHCIYYILKNNFSVNHLLYVGNETYFYKSPMYLLKEFDGGSVFLYRRLKKEEGNKDSYKTDLIGFRRDKNSLKCLTDWKAGSIGWGLEGANGNENPEEAYISTWPYSTSGVKVLENSCVNAEPQDTLLFKIINERDKIKYSSQMLLLLNFCGYSLEYDCVMNKEDLEDIYENKPINAKLRKMHKITLKRAVIKVKKLLLKNVNVQ